MKMCYKLKQKYNSVTIRLWHLCVFFSKCMSPIAKKKGKRIKRKTQEEKNISSKRNKVKIETIVKKSIVNY